MKTLADVDVAQKRVFLRADLDVPIEAVDDKTLESGLSMEQSVRLQNLKPTVERLLSQDVKQIVIAGHIGRPSGKDVPEGKPKNYNSGLSTIHILETLQNILGSNITFNQNLNDGTNGRLVLLENLRFWPGEIENEYGFAKQLSNLADIYINEAFGNSHRAHASMVTLPRILPHAGGLQLQREIEEFNSLLTNHQKPFIAVVGGAKIETKVPVIEHLAKIADFVLVGGELPVEIAQHKMKFSENVLVAKLTDDKKDISDESTQVFVDKIRSAKIVIWNGPMGMYEKGFEKGTVLIAQTIVESGAYSVVGGGETTEFLIGKNLLYGFSFVSTGGGAMLEFLAGKELPGIKALE